MLTVIKLNCNRICSICYFFNKNFVSYINGPKYKYSKILTNSMQVYFLLFAASILPFYSLKHILHHPHKSPIDLNGCDFSLYFSIYTYERKIRSTIIWIFYLCCWPRMNRYTPYQHIILLKTTLQFKFSKSKISFNFRTSYLEILSK